MKKDKNWVEEVKQQIFRIFILMIFVLAQICSVAFVSGVSVTLKAVIICLIMSHAHLLNIAKGFY